MDSNLALNTLLAIAFIYHAPLVWRTLVNNWKVCEKHEAFSCSHVMTSVKVHPNGWHQQPFSPLYRSSPLLDPWTWNDKGGLWQSKPSRLVSIDRWSKLGNTVSWLFFQNTHHDSLDHRRIRPPFYRWDPTSSRGASFIPRMFCRGNPSYHISALWRWSHD